MADLVWGEAVVGGETVPADSPLGAWLYRLNDDGTRRSVRYHSLTSSTGIYVPQDGIVLEESAGCIPSQGSKHLGPVLPVQRTTSISDNEREEGRYVGFANEGGNVYFGPEGTTPGTPFYRIRRILGQHALRYIAEHNPSQLRYADPAVHRVETIAHELTDTERVQAANSDEYIRGQTGLLWGFNEFMRYTPANRPDLWKPLVAELDAFLAPYCALCEGSGMSHRTIRKHPHLDWQKWQAAGLRFSVDRAFAATPFHKNGIITDSTRVADQTNFTHALDWASEGYVDDDYLAPRSQFADYPSNPVMPDFGANMTRSYLSSGWRLNYDAHMRDPLAGLEPGIYRKWCLA